MSDNRSLTPEQLAGFVIEFFQNSMPFNRALGFQIESLEDHQVQIRMPWNNMLMGNPVHKILHGGATAAILDTVGSVVALMYGIKQLKPEEVEDFKNTLANNGTIDMRVDYLRPGKGEEFIATASVIRRGRRVAVCRMELHNEQGQHIASGTGTYLVG
ncbi:thioesterase family protein [Paraglaciecola chathamensis]|uniref:thioesterase family protein n=1 Tax=Paraglaciecola chathamensis TaxID=368405 RepID=UPI00270B590E|nr:thioesterase family protein [Paraglaciecola chathamensis]MDO6839400.1 thioesterase family protein [Paraglaciecola chathamensis]